MKKCPQCGTQYSDDTLVFCLQDGSPLTSTPEADIPTVVLGETETREAVRRGSTPEGKRTNVALAVGLTAVAMLILFGLIGVVAWFYMRNTRQPVGSNTVNIASVPPGSPPTKESPTAQAGKPTSTPNLPKNSNSPLPPIDDAAMENEVVRTLDSWQAAAEATDIEALMAHYAPVVDYYNHSGASAASVRADKLRAFSRYDSIKLRLSNQEVTVDPEGAAVAVFDKEWNFGDGQSEGKVRQMMRLRRFGSEWRITAEKDVKLYYKR